MGNPYTYCIHILNGRLFEDTVGNYTCLTHNGASVVDYHIVSSELFPFITYFKVDIRDDSDHLPLRSRLSFTKNANENSEVQGGRNVTSYSFDTVNRYKWSDTNRDIFIENLTNALDLNMTDIIDSINNISINSAVHKILTIYESAAQNMRIQYKNI